MDWAREMVDRLAGAKNGEKARVLAEYQHLTGKSAATLYRIAARHGLQTGRKRRVDRGTLKCGLSDEALHHISGQIQLSAREVKGVIRPVSAALRAAVKSGVIAPGQVSEARLQAILRERDMGRAALDAPDPSIRMASLHPNHVHIFDASICIQYYLKGEKGLRIMDERDYREKKPANIAKVSKERLLRMILTDHFSHTIYLKYYLVAGENQKTTFDFLCSAWRGGEHDKMPFRGVPLYLLMDAGSANIAKPIMNLLRRLEVDTPANMPHNPKRQGSAECAQNIVESQFESGLRFEPATTLDQLNAWAMDWAAWWNTTRVHRRHGMTRTACWSMHIRQEQLRDLPPAEMLHALYAEPVQSRIVRQDNTISFNSRIYKVKCIEGIRPGKEVLVERRPYHDPAVAVLYDEQTYLIQPIGTMAGGFAADAQVIGQGYKAQPETTVQKAKKANEKLAFGDERGRDDIPFGGTIKMMGRQAEDIAAVPMPRRGTPIELDRSVVAANIPIMEFLKRLRDAGVTLSAELNRELRQEFGGAIETRRADEVIRAMAAGEEWRQRSEALRAEG